MQSFPPSVDEEGKASRGSSPVKFFILVLVLSPPFWLAGAVTSFQLLPGLPVSALMFICPAAAALILVYRENGRAGLAELLKKSVDPRRIKAKVWYMPMILLMPGIGVLSYALLRLTGAFVPAPTISLLAVLALFALFFVTAWSEELGWSGYALDPLQERGGALGAGLVLGLVWTAWHIVPYLQAHRSWTWIGWYGLFSVAARVLMVWLYNNTGKSVLAAAVFHAMINVTWQTFPVSGSHFDPRVTGLITACLAVLVTVVWGPRTLARTQDA